MFTLLFNYNCYRNTSTLILHTHNKDSLQSTVYSLRLVSSLFRLQVPNYPRIVHRDDAQSNCVNIMWKRDNWAIEKTLMRPTKLQMQRFYLQHFFIIPTFGIFMHSVVHCCWYQLLISACLYNARVCFQTCYLMFYWVSNALNELSILCFFFVIQSVF